jgi:putative sigma-54 modulation protein
VRVQITGRHCDVPADIRERTETQVASLSKYQPRASAADVVYTEEKLDKLVEIIIHIDGSEPVVASGRDTEFRAALDQVIDRAGRMLRRQRERRTDHKAPARRERAELE